MYQKFKYNSRKIYPKMIKPLGERQSFLFQGLFGHGAALLGVRMRMTTILKAITIAVVATEIVILHQGPCAQKFLDWTSAILQLVERQNGSVSRNVRNALRVVDFNLQPLKFTSNHHW